MDRVELLLRAAAAANDSGEVRYAVDLARQAVARVNTRPGRMRWMSMDLEAP
jgi:hypothetical protein